VNGADESSEWQTMSPRSSGRVRGLRGMFVSLLVLAVVAESASAQGEVSFPTQDGGLVFATDTGAGDDAVILAHGGRFTKESWAAQIPALVDAGFRTLAIDFRGRGKSRGGPGLESNQDSVHLDVLAAVAYVQKTSARRISIVGASFGGWASARAVTRLPSGTIDGLVLLASSPIVHPEDLHGRKLFVTARDDVDGRGHPRLVSIRDQFERAPEPKELLILPGEAHAQFIFETEQGPRLMAEIVAFLLASRQREASDR
jgi:alpha/beta superfamily hydrolase